MSTYSRPAKTVSGGGGSSNLEGNTLPAAELNADFDGIVTHINGQLDETNLRGATQIPSSMLETLSGTDIDDHASTTTEFLGSTNPGDSFSVTLPTDLTEEIESLRYRAKHDKRYGTNLKAWNSSGSTVNLGWTEPPIVGPNLILNGGLDSGSLTSGDAPDGWTEVGTIATSAIESVGASFVGGSDKRSLAFTGTNAGNGFSQTLTGLKGSTKYLLGVAYTRTSGGLAFSTTGGAGSGNYQNPTVTDNSSSGYAFQNIVVETDSSATDLVFRILTSESGANDNNVHSAWAYELSDGAPNELPHIARQEVEISTEDTSHPSTFAADWQNNWETITEFSLSQYIPQPGYKISYAANVSFGMTTSSIVEGNFAFRLKRDGTVVDGPYIFSQNSSAGFATLFNACGVIPLRDTVSGATPGNTYDYTVEVTAHTDGAYDSRVRLHPRVTLGFGNTIQSSSKAWLEVERI